MTRSLRPLVVPVVLLALLAGACAGESSKPTQEVLDARDTAPMFPNAELARSGLPPPGLGAAAEDRDFYSADQTYFVDAQDAQEQILQFFRTEMPKQGWTLEDPAVPSRNEHMADYCTNPRFIMCLSFVKAGVRAIISAPVSFSLSSSGPQGSNYSVHLEAK